MIRTEHLAKSFGELEVLKDINLTVEPGEVVVI
ncbi:MAG: polar amino acid ABC transporter ATP-binding protein, partial [Lachnospiraceae bacterium]|nr:polar amino acid ABC transporter ATP-binding protein [Lachnospiraceae bacterium]